MSDPPARDGSVRAPTALPRVVTLSANYGTEARLVGTTVAERLGLDFVDQAIPVTVAREMSVPLDRAEAHDDRSDGVLGRILRSMALTATDAPDRSVIEDERTFQQHTEAAIRQIAATTGGVIFGRAGMAVLADRPLTYRVRLEGPLDRRVRRAAQVEGISEAAARENALAADRARDTYAAHFYKVHRDNWGLYHLLLDATVLDPLDVGELVARAAEAFFAREQERA